MPADLPVALQPAATILPPSTTEGMDCWNQIGVAGDGSCPDLSVAIHCRNCPVYSAAGMRLLDRERPLDYQKHWTDYFSREKKSAAPARQSAVIFQVGAEWLALPTRAFVEVTEARPIHTLPHRRNGFVLGLTNVRGQLLVCISLGKLLGVERGSAPAMSSRLMVLDCQGGLVAFPVQDVHGVHRFHPDELVPAPAMLARGNSGLTRSMLTWKGRKVGCLEEEALTGAINRGLA
jgi:chemotaxis-related protein WspD